MRTNTRMKRIFLTLIPLTLACLVVACGSGSKDNLPPNPTLTMPERPVADYTFSNNKLEEILENRTNLMKGVASSIFAGKSYQYTELAGTLFGLENTYLFQLGDGGDNHIQLWFIEGGNICFIYDSTQTFDSFPCDESRISTSGDLLLIQSTTQSSGASITLELNRDMIEDAMSIGDTLLTTELQDNNLTINTSHAFSSLIEEVANREILSYPEHYGLSSNLGVSTYLQLKEIVEDNTGTNMTLQFDNSVLGSLDDVNMYTGLMIYENQMNTLVTANGSVFEAGTALFAAGQMRTLVRRSDVRNIFFLRQIGFRSWTDADDNDNLIDALDIPFTDKRHRAKATYFDTVLGEQGIDFYLFMLEAALHDHYWMTRTDLEKFGFNVEIR